MGDHTPDDKPPEEVNVVVTGGGVSFTHYFCLTYTGRSVILKGPVLFETRPEHHSY